MNNVVFSNNLIKPRLFKHNGKSVISLIDTASIDGVDLYFALKGKHDRKLQNEVEFWNAIVNLNISIDHDISLVIDSSKPLVSKISGIISSEEQYLLQKRSKKEIMKDAEKISWSKEEWSSQNARFKEMADTFEINKIKTNQRHKYFDLLFSDKNCKKIENKKVLIIDDSLFSGATVSAAIKTIEKFSPSEINIMTLFWCSTLRE